MVKVAESAAFARSSKRRTKSSEMAFWEARKEGTERGLAKTGLAADRRLRHLSPLLLRSELETAICCCIMTQGTMSERRGLLPSCLKAALMCTGLNRNTSLPRNRFHLTMSPYWACSWMLKAG